MSKAAPVKKLSLNKETIRALTADQLNDVAGGTDPFTSLDALRRSAAQAICLTCDQMRPRDRMSFGVRCRGRKRRSNAATRSVTERDTRAVS